MEQIKIFIVEDDKAYAKLLENKFKEDKTHLVEVFSTGGELLKNLYKKPSIITIAYRLPDISAEELLDSVLKRNINTPVVVISGQEDIKIAVSLLKEGIYDYVVKDSETIGRLDNMISNIKDEIFHKIEVDRLQKELIEKYLFENLIGQSGSMKKVHRTIVKAANANINVSLHGEVGTGKGLIAKTIHYNSSRKEHPFISIDLRAISPGNIDTELLGVDKSLSADGFVKVGLLERANQGTVYIEGFEYVNQQLQYYIQRILQHNEIVRVGGVEPSPLDIKVIVSYDGPLTELVARGKIKEQHYYRTMGIPIDVPPLRDRENDTIILANKFIQTFVKDNNMEVKALSPDAVEKLLSNSFLGNVQELKAIIELAAVMSVGNLIDADDLSLKSANNLSDFLSEEKTLKDYTYGIIKFYLDKYDNNILKVAGKLDIGKSTIYRMLQHGDV
ncbi:MAG: sigma-54-dependent Fis family transcriptional regulator [Flavobacteriales bacterium]|nr:sigma-54-dependent Fis family transcriptional regulator [Flavobacteriales bacterium]